MFAQVRDHSAGGEDLLRGRRERTQPRVPGRGAQSTGAEIEGHRVTIVYQSDSLRGFEHGNAKVDAVAEEYPREARRDDPPDPVLRESGDRILARAAAPEILSAHEDVALPHVARESRPGIAERVGVELVLADHERRVPAGDDLVRVEVVTEHPGSGHQSSLSISRPTPRDTLRAGRLTRRGKAAPRSFNRRSPQRRRCARRRP